MDNGNKNPYLPLLNLLANGTVDITPSFLVSSGDYESEYHTVLARPGIVLDNGNACFVGSTQKFHSNLSMNGDRLAILHVRDRLNRCAFVRPCKPNEMVVQGRGETLAAAGTSYGDLVHVARWLGLRKEAQEICIYHISVFDYKSGISELMEQHGMV